MSLQTNMNISVDFHDNKYIMVNAKQLDSGSRLIAVTCYNQGNIMNLTANKHTAYVRCRKADGYRVFNNCRINYKGEVLVELTEQMLAADGICYVDLVIVEKGKAIVNIDTGEIVTIDESPILSTMAFCVNVYEAAVENKIIESSYEYDGLNDLLQRADANYSEVAQLARSYAMGDANDIREDEDFDNSKYYSSLSKSYAVGDLYGRTKTRDRENERTDNAEYYSRLAKSYAKGNLSGSTNTRDDEGTDSSYYYSQMSKSFAMGGTGISARDGENVNNAEYYSRLSKSYARGGTNISERNSNGENESIDNAEYYSRLAKSYTIGSFDGSTGTRNDEVSENAKTYMETSLSHAITSQRYATGDTNTVSGEETDNAKYYSQMSRSYAMGDAGGVRGNEDVENAKSYMNNALDYATTSQRYAIGGTGTVDGEDTDNSEYYYKLARSYTKGDISLRTDEDKDNTEYYYKLAKSYTVGDTGLNERVNENEDNAKYYYQLAQAEANNANEIKNTAKTYMDNTEEYMGTVQTYMDNTQSYMNTAKTYMDNSETYMNNASNSADSADISKTNAAESANRAADVADSIADSVKSVEDNAKIALDSATSASENAENASESAASALNSASSASESATSALQNYTETNYIYLQTKEIAVGLNGAFLPMGTIEFSELATLIENDEVKAGYLYNISDAFITDDTFKRVGIECAVGTNVYYTSDGYWDCLTSGTVNGVKGDNELEYRQGNVNITAENVGAIPSVDIATVDEIKSYLGI